MATKKVTLTAETELQPDVVIEMLTKRVLIGDKRIVSDKARDAQQEKNKMAYHNTQLLLKHYRTIAWMLECFPDTIAEELDQPFEGIDKIIEHIDFERAYGNRKLENRLESVQKTPYSIEITKVYAADKIKRPRIEEKKVECFTVAEQKVLEEAIKNDRRMKTFGILLSLYTGLRIGELLALEWTDVDFNKRELSISKTCHDSKDEFGRYVRFVNPPKTSTSMRVIPIPKQLIPLLREMKKKNSSKYVVGDGDKVISVRSYQRTYELILKKHGLSHRGFHALRHTFATRAIECGIDVKTLSEILGHKNPTVTLNRYAHSLMEHKKDMMNPSASFLLSRECYILWTQYNILFLFRQRLRQN